MMVEIITV